MVSNARLDLPEPETPVTTVIALCGIWKLTFFRLCTRAPRTTIASCDSGCTIAVTGVPCPAVGMLSMVGAANAGPPSARKMSLSKPVSIRREEPAVNRGTGGPQNGVKTRGLLFLDQIDLPDPSFHGHVDRYRGLAKGVVHILVAIVPQPTGFN